MADKMIDEGGFAFPTTALFTPDGKFLSGGSDGMSLRDWLAGQAIGAIIRQCASDLQFRDGRETSEQYFARKSYEVADAMIAARKAGA